MPWAKRADGTWGNVTVEAPVLLPTTDSESEPEEDIPEIKSTRPQNNLVATRAAQFQAAQIQIQTASSPRAPPLIVKKKKPPPPPVPAEQGSPAPPYAPAFPPRRTATKPSHDDDVDEPDKLARFESNSLRRRAVSSTASLPAPPKRPPAVPAHNYSEEDSEEETVNEAPSGIKRRPPPPPIPRPSLVQSQALPGSRPPLPSRAPSQATPPLPPRSPAPSRQSAHMPPLPPRQLQAPPPLPSRTPTPTPPPLPSRSNSSLVEEDEEGEGEGEGEEEEEEEEEEEKPALSSSTRNPNLRPPPTRTKSSSSLSDRRKTPSWSSDKTGFAKGKAVEMARNRRNCLNPPPSCFSRAPPELTNSEKGIQITYAPLAAPVILRSSNSNDLAKAMTTGRAFPSKPPPFLSHDVQREDWDKLWDDIDETARIEMRASAGLSVATLPLMPIFGAGFAVSTIAERKLRAGRVGPTCKLIEAWNVNFFRPRRLDVYIAQDSIRLSGPSTTPASRKAIDPAFVKWQEADGPDKQLALKEFEKWKGKFRFVVQSWPAG